MPIYVFHTSMFNTNPHFHNTYIHGNFITYIHDHFITEEHFHFKNLVNRDEIVDEFFNSSTP